MESQVMDKRKEVQIVKGEKRWSRKNRRRVEKKVSVKMIMGKGSGKIRKIVYLKSSREREREQKRIDLFLDRKGLSF